MNQSAINSGSPPDVALRQRLEDLRHRLLRLHKTLVDYERVSFERLHGRVPSTGEFLQLVIHHEWFAWLRPFSALIVQMDERLSDAEALTVEEADRFLEQIRALLQSSGLGMGFSRQYESALQNDPAVVLAHAEAGKLLGASSSGSQSGNERVE